MLASPWLSQLRHTRVSTPLSGNLSTDVVIVGAGIAGVMTAYFTLKYTDKKVVVVDAGHVAHGATGHNAGQVTSYFEHAFSYLVDVYGLTLAAKAQESIFYAWQLLDEICVDANIQTPLSRVTGYAGCTSLDQVQQHLKNLLLQEQAGLHIESILIADTAPGLHELPHRYANLYAVVPADYILSLLETRDPRYIAALAGKKGCVNSARLCEELVQYLEKKYARRFRLFEETPVETIVLHKKNATVKTHSYQVKTDHVVLCTNGYKTFRIEHPDNTIQETFEQSVTGTVGYMAGYLEPPVRPPTAISYFLDTAGPTDAYFYLTRRLFEDEREQTHNLVCIGGPELTLSTGMQYHHKKHPYPKTAEDEITHFLTRTYRYTPHYPIPYAFQWHGLMGYTPSGLRAIGPDPHHPALIYNLGCNGVGILPSIYGGRRVSLYLKHHALDSSLFDPSVQRSAV